MIDDLLPLLLVLVPLTASAAFVDLRTGLIPNRLVLVGLVAGCVVRVAAAYAALPAEAPQLVALAGVAAGCLLGVCIGGAGPYLLFRLGALGGGDVKLLAAVGAGVGPALGIRIELFAFVLAALYALARLALAGRLLALLRSSAALLLWPFFPGARRGSPSPGALGALRFGPAIFLATLLVAAECWGQR